MAASLREELLGQPFEELTERLLDARNGTMQPTSDRSPDRKDLTIPIMDQTTPALSKPEFRLPQSHAAFARANRVIPGGVNSPARAFGARRRRAAVHRAGRRCLPLRHRRPHVHRLHRLVGPDDPGPCASRRSTPAVAAALELGSSFGAPTVREIEIAEAVAAAVPSIEKVRFVSSGTEAAMSAVRVARGVTGRSKIIKMTGHYHGHVDALLVQAGSAATTLGTPNSPGVTEGAAHDTILCPFNDAQAVADALTRFPARSPRSCSSRSPATWGWCRPRRAIWPRSAS